jgi:hypothetical protein
VNDFDKIQYNALLFGQKKKKEGGGGDYLVRICSPRTNGQPCVLHGSSIALRKKLIWKVCNLYSDEWLNCAVSVRQLLMQNGYF